MHRLQHPELHYGVRSELMFMNRYAAQPDRVLPTSQLWTRLLNAQARLGLRDDFERTAARLMHPDDRGPVR